jgi:thiamine kinase-like enzyme
LYELGIDLPGTPEYELVSRWAAKHVWRVDINGQPWAFIRYLLGPADRYPDRWRHLRLAVELFEAHVGPRVLGMTAASEALSGRAAIVEAALTPISRDVLEARPEEAIGLMARLHGCIPLHEALSVDLTEADRDGFSPIANLFHETHERWFEAVAGRWLEMRIPYVEEATGLVSDLLAVLESIDHDSQRISIVVPAHNDPNHGNFMANRKGALRMIDFEGLALSNPVADLGIFLTWYVDRHQHRKVLQHYPLAEPDAILERMRVWVPLRYLNLAAHWAGRLSRARDREGLEFAANSIDEWLRGAAELLYEGASPDHLIERLDSFNQNLLALKVPNADGGGDRGGGVEGA